MLNIARSNYYYKGAEDLQKQKEDADLRDRIENIIVEHERYGYRRVTAQLRREGIIGVNKKRVQRIMQQEGLICKATKKWVTTTDSNHRYPVYPNLLKDAEITGVNQAWVADITYMQDTDGICIPGGHSGCILAESNWMGSFTENRYGINGSRLKDGDRRQVSA
jgi:transposase InsO family protein